jgi:lipid-A-disaccharide synthase
MRYYLIAGEASGDLHGSGLIKEIRKSDPSAIFRCWGGDLMSQAGGTIVRHYRDLAFMGFIEVVTNLGAIYHNLRFCKQDILTFNPDAVILIDYPGFNLRIAEFAHEKRLKVVYYISPQVWAWKKSRLFTIKRNVDRMFVILPFEKEFYGKYGFDVEFVGHPLLDVIDQDRNEPGRQDFITRNRLSGRPVIALLPGSRKQEISRMLPIMASIMPEFRDYEFVIATAPSVDPEFCRAHVGPANIPLVTGQTYDLLRNAHAALVTSGTATLETALFKVPEVVCYKGSFISFLIAKRLVDVKFISLVNLVMDREVVKELVQDSFNSENLAKELHNILDESARTAMLGDFNELRDKLGGPGAAHRTAAGLKSLLGSRIN